MIWVLVGLIFDTVWGLIVRRSFRTEQLNPKQLKIVFCIMAGLIFGVWGLFGKGAVLGIMLGIIIGALSLGLFLKLKTFFNR